jgi:hypothetical protein
MQSAQNLKPGSTSACADNEPDGNSLQSLAWVSTLSANGRRIASSVTKILMSSGASLTPWKKPLRYEILDFLISDEDVSLFCDTV